MKATKEELTDAHLILTTTKAILNIHDNNNIGWRGLNLIERLLDEVVEQPRDEIVETVVTKFQQRSEAGIKKYGTTLDRNDLTEKEWFTHLQEELMDATLYVERILKALSERK
jgi:hypothetical protein